MKYKRGMIITSDQFIGFKEEELYETIEIKLFPRDSGEFKNKAYVLNKHSNWHIVIDSENVICLVPTKKLNT